MLYVNWCLVDWYSVLPSGTAFFVTLVFGGSAQILRPLLEDYAVRKQARTDAPEAVAASIAATTPDHADGGDVELLAEDTRRFAEDIAVDWSTRINFIATMFVALGTCFSIEVKNPGLAVITFLALALLFAVGLLFILRHGTGDLARHTSLFGWRDCTVCNAALLVVYAALSIEVILGQALGSTPACK